MSKTVRPYSCSQYLIILSLHTTANVSLPYPSLALLCLLCVYIYICVSNILVNTVIILIIHLIDIALSKTHKALYIVSECVCVCVSGGYDTSFTVCSHSRNISATTKRQHKRRSYAWGWRSARLCAYIGCLVNMLPPAWLLAPCSSSPPSPPPPSSSSSASYSYSSRDHSLSYFALFNFHQEENILILQ